MKYDTIKQVQHLKVGQNIAYCLFLLFFSITSTMMMAQQICGTNNVIGGTVFLDVNANGENDEPVNNVAGVSVIAYDAFGFIVDQTTSAEDGSYLLIVPDGVEVRLEFGNIEESFSPTVNGPQSNTSTQFVISPTCELDFGINSVDCQCNETPDLIIPQWKNGTLAVGPDDPALLSFSYAQQGPGANYGSVPPTAGPAGLPNPVATWGEVGTLYGVAGDRYSGSVFASAFLRRYAAFGPLGEGGIYRVDDPLGVPNVLQLIDLGDCINIPTVPRQLASGRGLAATDAQGHAQAGRVSLGDMDVSPDGLFLYTVNLSEKELVQIRIRNVINGPLITPTCADVQTFVVPAIAGCVNDDNQPFGLGMKNGNVYVGSVCTASSTQNSSDLAAEIFEFDPTTETFNPVLSQPIDLSAYEAKGCVLGFQSPRFPNNYCCEWNPWLQAGDYSFEESNEWVGAICYPQPLLADIEFDESGSMILGFADRFAFQSGWLNFYIAGSTRLLNGLTGGDLLYAYYDRDVDTYVVNLQTPEVLDANGNVVREGCGIDDEFGRGVEFYCGDNNGTHPETALGALALRKGYNRLAYTSIDAGLQTDLQDFPLGYGSGVAYINSQTASLTDEYYAVYYNGLASTFGKSAGLGDLDLLCSAPPIEIGNRLWVDENKNGRQDPTESGIPGVTIDLYDSAGNVIATTTTNANGEYYFNSLTNAPDLNYMSTYYVVVRDYTPGVGVNGTDLLLTTPNASDTNDENDSDGLEDGGSGIAAIGNLPYTEVTIGNATENNHSLDFGFFPSSCGLFLSATLLECNNGDDPTFDVQINVGWVNAGIGEEIEVEWNGETKTITTFAEDGTSSVLFQIPVGEANNIVTATHATISGCEESLTFSTVDPRLSIVVTPGDCFFDPEDVESYTDLEVEVTWNQLNVGDEVVVSSEFGDQASFTVGSTSGVETVNVQAVADGMIQSIFATVAAQDDCAVGSTTFQAPDECPGCVLKVSQLTVGECFYDGTNSFSRILVEVFWFDLNSPDNIVVTVDGQTRNLPQTAYTGTDTVSFVVPANGSVANVVRAEFANNATCFGEETYDAREECEELRDLTLEKYVSNDCPMLNEEVIYTLIVRHQGDDFDATGVRVEDVAPPGVNYVETVSISQGTFDGSVWDIGTLSFGDEVILEFSATVDLIGVHYNTAEISLMNEDDSDSTPGNGVEGEDDLDKACVTVPIPICDGETVEISAESGYFNYQWFFNGVAISGATSQTITVGEPGEYSYTATRTAAGNNEVNPCCPVKIELDNCDCDIFISDVNFVPCVEDNMEVTTVVNVCVEWFDQAPNSIITVTATGANTNTNGNFTILESSGSNCFDLNVEVGEAITINASIENCTITDQVNINSPTYCFTCNVSIDDVDITRQCFYDENLMLSRFEYTVDFSWSGLNVGDTLELISSGNSLLYPVQDESGSDQFSFTGVANDMTQNVILYDQANPNLCVDQFMFEAPESCDPPRCELTIEDVIPGFCNQDETQQVIVTVSWEYAEIGDVLQVTLNGETQSTGLITAGNAVSGGRSFTFNVDQNSSGNVEAFFSNLSSCRASLPFETGDCPPCELFSSQPTFGNCEYNPDSMWYEYEVCFDITWNNLRGEDGIFIEPKDYNQLPGTQESTFIDLNGRESGSETACIRLVGDGAVGREVSINTGISGCGADVVFDSPECIFDLALVKTVSANTQQPVKPNSLVSFDIQVFNQGTIDAFDISIVDYIPEGLILEDSDWTMTSADEAELNTPISRINAGGSAIIQITFRYDTSFEGTSAVNYAEILSFDSDDNPNNPLPVDEDSTPADNKGQDELPVDNKILDNETGSPQDDDLDSDDYDPALIFLCPNENCFGVRVR